MNKKIYDDGMSPQLRHYYRNKERILELKLKQRTENPEHYKKLRIARKDKENEQKKIYRQNNKEKIAAYFLKNKDRLKESKKASYLANREQINSARRRRYAEDKNYSETIKEKMKNNYAANPEIRRSRTRAWVVSNPEKVRLQSSIKRARKRNATGKVSKDIVNKLKILQNSKCACCHCDINNTQYHIDHINPLALGGEHDDKNMQLLCKSCNLSKHAKYPIDFMQSRGYLL